MGLELLANAKLVAVEADQHDTEQVGPDEPAPDERYTNECRQ